MSDLAKDSGSYHSDQADVFKADEPQIGVKTVEAAEKVYGRYSKWFLFIGFVRSDTLCVADITDVAYNW
jgi:hypothetical protein